MKFFYNLGRQHPNYDFMQFFAYRTSIDRFRNTAAEIALKKGCSYVMFIDDDMKLEPSSFALLLEACEVQGYGILAALNYIRGYPFKIMSFKYDLLAGHRRLTCLTQEDMGNNLGGVIPCDAIGTAVCLISIEVFKKTPKPYFLTGPHGTEDIYMCLKAKEAIPSLKIGMHSGVQTGHLLDPEIISHGTRAALMKYYESYMTPAEIRAAQEDAPGIAAVPDVGNRELHYEDLMGIQFDDLIERGI